MGDSEIRPRLLYIASLPHSGSTLLDLLVGQHPQLVGLGGIDRAVRMLTESPGEASERVCSCGVPVPQCAYWGKVLQRINRGPRPRNLPERYALGLNVFADVFGPGAVPVDSSKIREPLLALRAERSKPLDLRVIHLAKDFRTAAVSFTENKRRKSPTRRPGWLLTSEGAWKWWRENRKLEEAIRSTNWPVLQVGYEALCLEPNGTLAHIARFAGEDPDFEFLPSLTGTRSHLFTGNRMRNADPALRYDRRWMSRWDWLPAALLMPWLHKANRRWVHTIGQQNS